MGLKAWIIPQERQFFDLLERLAATVDEGAIALADLLHEFRDVPMKCRRIKDVEHHADEIVHRVYEELNKTFITPIDREDIQSLATELDNVLDMIEAASSRIGLYEIDRPTEAMVQLGDVIKDGMRLLKDAVGLIRNMKQADGVERISIEVHRLENVAANAIATIVATKVLTPTKAVAMAAAGNFVGMVFITNAIAETIGKGIIDTNVLGVNALPLSDAALFHSLAIIMGGVVGAIAWDIITWLWGLPTSSSHALIGGLIGASALAAGTGSILLPSTTNMLLFLFVTGMAFVLGAASYFAYDVIIRRHRPTLGMTILAGLLTGLLPAVILGKILLKGLVQIVVYMVAAPLVGLVFAFGLALVVIRLFRRHTPTKVNHEFKRLQLVSSFFYSVTHGTNDAQKGMGIITLILIIAAIGPPWGPPLGQFAVPFWVIVGAHASISLGTFFGGWRIVRTMSQRVTHLRPWQGFSAETGGGIALASSALAGIPVSTTHVIASAIMGVGATKRLSAVRWGVARRIFCAWIITIPASAGDGMAAYGAMRLLFGV